MSGFLLYFRYIRLHFRANLQYKGWPVQILMTIFNVISDPIEVFLLFARFGALGEWSGAHVMLMYGIAVAAYGLAETFVRGLDYFPSLVRNGEFDRVLLRPRSTLLQAVTLRFHVHRLSRVVGGLLMMCLALSDLNVSLSLLDILMLALALLSGLMVYAGVFLYASAISFYTIQPLDFTYIFTNGSYQVAKVAPTMLPKWLKTLFMYIVPMLPFWYLPAAAVCGWGVDYLLGFIALPAACAFLLPAYAAWCVGLRHYKSTGS